MVHKHCCFGTCNSDSRYTDREFMENVFFVPFPKPKRRREKCLRWIRACARQDFNIDSVTKYTYICSKHFVGGRGPTSLHPDPIPGNFVAQQVRQFVSKRKAPAARESRPPKEFKGDGTSASTALEHVHAQGEGETLTSEKGQTMKPEATISGCHDKITQTEFVTENTVSLAVENKRLKARVELLESSLKLNKFKKKLKSTSASKKNTPPRFSVEFLKHNASKFQFYTGMLYSHFLCMWNFLGPSTSKLTLWSGRNTKSAGSPLKCSLNRRKVPPKDQLLLTLIRLRLGVPLQDLAYRFEIAKSTASRIFVTWVQFLYKHFISLKQDMFPPRQIIQETLPKTFKSYRSLRVIIDCTEIFVQQPRDFKKQGNLYSQYKSHTTYKVLIGVSPTGAVMFISDCFEGSMSDRETVLQSGFLDHLHEGDLVLADRGFRIRDLVQQKKAHINIPPFLGKRDKLTPQEELQTKKLARHRIHVERAIERLKKFRIIKNVVPLSLEPIISQIVFVVGCLVNFQKPLVA